MILLIISVVMIIIGVFILMYENEDVGQFLIALFTSACIILITMGYTSKPSMLQKQLIEKALETSTDILVINEAIEYNNSINRFNNYFFRFTIEDRSIYFIDIDKYIKE